MPLTGDLLDHAFALQDLQRPGRDAVRNLVVYGDPAPGEKARPVVAGLTDANVEIVNGPGTSTVSLRGFELDALFTKVKLDGRPTVTFPVRGPQ